MQHNASWQSSHADSKPTTELGVLIRTESTSLLMECRLLLKVATQLSLCALRKERTVVCCCRVSSTMDWGLEEVHRESEPCPGKSNEQSVELCDIVGFAHWIST